MRHQERTFLLCVKHTFIYSSSLYYFQKVKQKKSYLIKNEVFEDNQTYETKSIICRFPLMFKHIPVEKVETFKTLMNCGMFVN